MSTSTRDRLVGLLAPLVEAAGLDLEDVVVVPAGKRRLVRVVVDGDDGVSLDDVAVVSRSISTALDEADAEVLGRAPYTLEVTSPGVDRPLTAPRHWRRARGRLVRATLADGGAVTGRVTAADDESVLLDVDGAERRLAFPEVARATVQVEFSRPATAEPASASESEDGDERSAKSDAAATKEA